MRSSLFALRVLTLVGILAALAMSIANTLPASAKSVGRVTSLESPQTNPTPTLATYPPQAGFNPLTATSSDLLSHGYPPRPSSGPALIAWQNAMTNALHYESPDPVYSTVVHRPVTHDVPLFTPTIQYTPTWAGHIIPQDAIGGYNFTTSQAFWIQPAVPANAIYTNYQDAPDASFWTGIGVNNLVQAGVDSISTTTPTYRFWTEDYPLGTDWEGPSVSPGNEIYVSVTYSGPESGGTATYFLENESQQVWMSFTNSAPYDGWRAANFINEFAEGVYLPDFGATNFTNCGAGGEDLWWNLQTTNNDRQIMTTNGESSGTPMSDAGAADNSTAGFTDTWESSGP